MSFLKSLIPDVAKEFIKDLSGHNFIKNFYKTRHKKNVLISYINKPFIQKHAFGHTNLAEARAIADVFAGMNFNVDLINYTAEPKDNLSSYDVIFGLGKSVEYALRHRSNSDKTFVIWHGTGSSPFYSNKVTIDRLYFSFLETGKLLIESSRFLSEMYPLSYSFADLIVLYGNETTRATYADHSHCPIELISPTTYFTHAPGSKTSESLKHYVWFGSAGSIHKGLDLLLCSFRDMPDLHLHICGDLRAEPAFMNAYHSLLFLQPNIHYHGFVDIQTSKFRSLMDAGAFVILPSCSEGIATSVLTAMANGGMIPIVTDNAGIDLMGRGIRIESLDVSGVKNAIEKSQQLPVQLVNNWSIEIVNNARKNFTIDRFSINLRDILIKHLPNHE